MFKSDENQLCYAWKDKRVIRTYLNTAATAQLAIAE